MTTRTTTNKYLGLALLLVTTLLTCCSRAPEILLIQGKAQGTTYHISFVAPADTDATFNQALADAVTAELARIDKVISNYRNDSEIEQFNSLVSTEPVQVNAEIVALIEQARSVNKASLGCYDLTIKPLFDLWGFKKNQFSPPSEQDLAATMLLVGMDKLETIDATHLRKQVANLRVDLSSIGQGYSIAQLSAILERHNITNYIVEIGGELKARGFKPGGKPWRLALEKPLSNVQKVEKIAVFASPEPQAMMPSGTYRHYFDADGKRYSHILDARAGTPITHTSASATVINADPALADAWSTAFLCLGSQAGIPIADQLGLAVLFIDQTEQGLVEVSSKALRDNTNVRFEKPSE